MKFHAYYLVLASFASLLFSCQKGNELAVVSKNFSGEVAEQQNLVFNFNRDIYPDSLLQRWDSTEYIVIKPAVKGQFKWNSSSELVFSPIEKFQPGKEYTATLSKHLLDRSKKKYPISDEPILFHTAPLRIENVHISWTRGQSMANIMVQLDLELNYEVDATKALTRIELSSEGRTLTTTSLSSGTGKTLSLQFLPPSEKDEDVPLQIRLANGIPVAHSDYVSQKDTNIQTVIPSRFNLQVTNIVSQHSGLEGSITINTSQPVHEENLRSYIHIEPEVAFEVTTNDAGFTISSTGLKADNTYELTISKNLEGAFGGKMKADYTSPVSFRTPAPAISFNNARGMYLSSQGFKNLSLNIVSIARVEVTVVKVYENNLEHFLRRGKSWGYYYDEEREDEEYSGGGYDYYNTEEVGDTIWHREYETSKLPGQNAARILHLDFQDKIKGYDGVYVITVGSRDHRWILDSRILSLSDIGLIVKEDADNMYVFANSIKNATALAHVKLNFISTNNQLLYSATTDAEGLAVFRNIEKSAPGFKVGMVTAKMNDDFSFIWLAQSEVATSRFDVGGRVPNAAKLNAMIYAERNLYRPGETIHVTTIVRDESWNKPGEMPVKMKLVMPNGKEFATMRKILNEEGSAETSFSIPATANTGTYTLNVYTGNDVLLNSYDLSIEDFIPDRIKSSLKIDKTAYHVGDSLRAFLQADNLFGTPAAERNYEMELNVSKTDFSPAGYEDYDFSIANNIDYSTQFKQGRTGDKGGGSEIFGIRAPLRDLGVLKGTLSATVFDETGRPVHRYENFMIYTQPVFAGVKLADEYVGTNQPLHVGLIALGENGQPRSASLKVSVIKKEWNTVIQQDGSRYRYVSQKTEKLIRQQTITTGAGGKDFVVTPELSGEYELRVTAGSGNGYVSASFYAWGWGRTAYSSFEVNNEGNVTIKPDKEKYNTGEDMTVLLTTPFDGKLLVTLERDKMIRHFQLKTENKSATIKLRAEDLLVPNVYITATLIRPMDGSDLPLTVAHGFRSVRIENPQNKLPVTIITADQSRSRQKQTLLVKTAPHAFVTVAAVDEGILQVKNYRTPNAYDYFYQKVALTARSYDIYPLLLPEVRLTRSSTGGDGADESALRVNPMFVNRVKNVSFWSGIRQADASGNLKYDIEIPQFSGDLRVMAIAYSGKRFGGADKHMKVADPVVLSTALPRFLSPGDEVVVPVTLTNTTANAADASVSLQVQGPLEISDGSTRQVNLAPQRDGRVVFHIKAAGAIGAGKVTVSVKAMRETFTNETELSIRPAASLQKRYASGEATEQSPARIALQHDFISGTARGKVVVSKSPLVQFSKNLNDLVRYPYGCVEQTTSAAFPQLYYHDLVKNLYGTESTDANPAYHVQQAILKLQSMQLSNGSLSYWPGYGSESWWGSAYAAHFLLEAKKAGYEVNTKTLDRLFQYLKYRLTRRETETLYYNENLSKEIAAKEIAYSLYVLALAGQPQPSTMNYYKAHPEMLSLDSKYLIGGAYALAGQPVMAKELTPGQFEGERSRQALGGSFYSYIRDEALALNTLLDTDPRNPQIGNMAKHLSQQVKQARYLNTQENAWTILALGKIARRSNNTTATALLLDNGKKRKSTDNTMNLDVTQLTGNQLTLQVKGKGSYYYFSEMSGITADGSITEEDSYLKVRRSFFDRNGHPVNEGQFRQNDLVVVRISLESAYNGTVENVAITDMLPAGLEVENTRLTEIPGMDWIKDQAEADYVDFRDDRVNFFTDATSKPKHFYYMARAVSPGKYKLGPVLADAMYDGSYHSYHGAGTVKVTER